MGVFRKQKKQDQASDWVSPGQMTYQPAGPGGPPGAGARPMPVRLRALHDDGPGQWLRGALRLAPGSLLWEPDEGISADPVELAAAWAAPAPGRRGPDMATHVETPAGRFQLELDPDLFQMSQELVAEQAAKRTGPPADPGAFPPPAG
jgi:hypothetical protein